MQNKIAMVNKELHQKLFQDQQSSDHEEEPIKIRRKIQLPPSLLLKTMIKKGLTNTQDIHPRPHTALNHFRKTADQRYQHSRMMSVPSAKQKKQISQRRIELPSQSNVEFDFITSHPKQFDEVGQILNKLSWEKEQENGRKKIKLEKYGQKKFRYAWSKCNIPQ